MVHSVQRKLFFPQRCEYRAATGTVLKPGAGPDDSVATCRSGLTREGDQDPGERYRVLADLESNKQATRGIHPGSEPPPCSPPTSQDNSMGMHKSVAQEERVGEGGCELPTWVLGTGNSALWKCRAGSSPEPRPRQPVKSSLTASGDSEDRAVEEPHRAACWDRKQGLGPR